MQTDTPTNLEYIRSVGCPPPLESSPTLSPAARAMATLGLWAVLRPDLLRFISDGFGLPLESYSSVRGVCTACPGAPPSRRQPLLLDLDAKSVHRRGALLLVVGGVDEDVVEDLVEDWDVGDCAVHNGAALVDPQRRALLHRADVDVRAPRT